MGIVKLNIRDFFLVSSVFYLLVVLLSFGLSVFHERDSVLFPLVSYSVLSSPEIYIYRIGLIISSVLILMKILLLFVYFANENVGGLHVFDRISVVFGMIVSVSCALMAGISKDDSFVLHAVAAACFYTAMQGYLLFSSLRLLHILLRVKTHSFTRRSFGIKFSITAISLCCYILFAKFCFNFNEYYYAAGAMEWIMYFTFTLFVDSFALDFSKSFVVEIWLLSPHEKSETKMNNIIDQLYARKIEA